jgi:hypothetical protein
MRVLGVLGALLLAAQLRAAPRPSPLTPLPHDQLLALAPSLRGLDLALIEVDARGGLRQLTTLTLVAAPPATVREVVAHPERYGEFVHNMRESIAHTNSDGTIDHHYRLDYTVVSVEGRHRYVFPTARAEDAAAPIEMFDPDEDGVRHYRWEFLAVPGGTLLVLYGYARMPDSGLVASIVKRARTLEYGLVLTPQMTLLLAMKQRAAQLARLPPPPPTPAPTPPPSLAFLLARGVVASFRVRDHRVAELSLIDRVPARADVFSQVTSNMTAWPRYVPTIDRVVAVGTQRGLPAVQLTQALPLMSWDTTWGMAASPGAVDLFGLEGDLAGARMRFDIRALPGGGAEIVLRAVASFAHGSLVVDQLYKLEPLFEYGVDVGLDLVILRGLETRALELSSTAKR